jgi:hypothetical protein
VGHKPGTGWANENVGANSRDYRSVYRSGGSSSVRCHSGIRNGPQGLKPTHFVGFVGTNSSGFPPIRGETANGWGTGTSVALTQVRYVQGHERAAGFLMAEMWLVAWTANE